MTSIFLPIHLQFDRKSVQFACLDQERTCKRMDRSLTSDYSGFSACRSSEAASQNRLSIVVGLSTRTTPKLVMNYYHEFPRMMRIRPGLLGRPSGVHALRIRGTEPLSPLLHSQLLAHAASSFLLAAAPLTNGVMINSSGLGTGQGKRRPSCLQHINRPVATSNIVRLSA